MKMTEEQRKKIITLFPKQRGNVKIDSGWLLDALLYILENGCGWRALPACFGPWHTVYMRVSRRAKNGTLERIFQTFRDGRLTNSRIMRRCLLTPVR
jgi:transposase